MATPENQSQSNGGKTRRRHKKSRNGCCECKRRRVKCDEMKPSCTRCFLALDKCIYLPARRSAAKDQRDKLYLPSLSCSFLSPSPSTTSYSERSPSFRTSTRTTPELADAAVVPEELSDTDLYHHYLQHTSRTLTHCQRDQSALQIGMPTLALQSKTVFHSVLAASAACLGWDMISREPTPDVNVVNKVLMTGYRHYNLASERMRESLSRPDASKLESLLASALMLVPFATASQQINHWISARSEAQEFHKPLSTTPRDVIIIMRGIQTTLQTLDWGSLSPNLERSLETEFEIDSSSALPEVNNKITGQSSSRSHVMVPVLAATSEEAFFKLENRLESVFLHHDSDGYYDSLSACRSAFEILKDIRSTTFSASSLPSSSSFKNLVEKTFQPESVSRIQVASWLRSFASRSINPPPSESLTRFLLTFYVKAPQAYLDLVLPLLDQRLETPIGVTSVNIPAELTRDQVLALDIYAHWSVLMFLVEEESWWIGNLPAVTLSGMVNRYGDNFVTKLWPENGGQEQWWPGSMLKILREIKQYR